MIPVSLELTPVQRLTIEFSRVSLFVLVLCVGLISFLLQPRFINWSVLGPIYAGVVVSLGFHLVYISTLEKFYGRHFWLFASFLLDSLFISSLIYSSGQNQSLFLFLHLANIIMSGLLFQSRGAYLVAMFTCVTFTVVSVFSGELKGLNYTFMLFLNNAAFFLVAGLSGFLSDQLHAVGLKLQETGIKLKSLAELNEAIVENSPMGVVTFDTRGNIFHRNPEADKIFDEDRGGLNIFELLGPLKISSEKDLSRFQVQFLQKNANEKRDLQVFVRPLRQTGDGNYLALIEDRTEMKRLEERAFQNEKLAAIGGLAAGIAHEIRNPLAGISGSIEMLSQTTNNDDDKKLMAIVMREIDRLNGLITEFLDYAKPEPTPRDPILLSHLLREVVEFSAKNKSSQIDIELNIDENISILGYGDKLRQAFLNIVINAFQAMGESVGAVLKVDLHRVDDYAVVRVTDTGSGMTEQTRKRIFEPFFTTKSKGTGLGLAMTHKILQSHHARILVESEKGKGTTFELSFPLDKNERIASGTN